MKSNSLYIGRVVTCEEMRAIDRRAQEEFGIPQETLMENAGRAVAEEIQKYLKIFGKGPFSSKVLLFCGGGNNGGDGFVTARVLWERGVPAKVFLLKPSDSLKGTARKNFEFLKIKKIPFEELPETDKIRSETEASDLLVDAILGTGIARSVSGSISAAIRIMNASHKPIFAVDVPSGLDADAGVPLGTAVQAKVTITMGAMKTGFLKSSARIFTGKIVVADIGFPKELIH